MCREGGIELCSEWTEKLTKTSKGRGHALKKSGERTAQAEGTASARALRWDQPGAGRYWGNELILPTKDISIPIRRGNPIYDFLKHYHIYRCIR